MTVQRYYCYDPRIMKYAFTDNPGLVFGWYAQKVYPAITDDFWEKVKEMADYCDQEVDAASKRIVSSDSFEHPVKCSNCEKEFRQELPADSKRGDLFVVICSACDHRDEYVYEGKHTMSMKWEGAKARRYDATQKGAG